MVPLPPDRVTPRRATLKAGRTLYRVHPLRFAATAFNPGRGRHGRFHPFRDETGRVVPTLYAADRADGALSESVFRNVVGGNRLLLAHLANTCLTEIVLRVDLDVADLTGPGLKALGLRSRSDLLDCGESQYRRTARWAEAIHRSEAQPQGMIWMSRQFDLAMALLAFGDRVDEDSFTIVRGPLLLDRGAGLSIAREAATEARIDVVQG